MSKLVEGLRMLNQADPCVETLVQETGEHVILTAGELHLEVRSGSLVSPVSRLISYHSFSPTALSQGSPRSFRPNRDHRLATNRPLPRDRRRWSRQVFALLDCFFCQLTAQLVADMAPPKTADRPRGTVLGSVQSGLITFALRAVPLPEEVTTFLIANLSTLKRLQRDRRGGKAEEESDEARGDVAEGVKPVEPEEFWPELEKLLQAAGKEWSSVADQIWAFGPRRVGPNLLIDRTNGAPRS